MFSKYTQVEERLASGRETEIQLAKERSLFCVDDHLMKRKHF